MNKTKKIVLIALLSALGSILGLFEQMMPLPFVVPGLRLGISNILVLTGILIFGLKEGIIISLLKSILLMLLSGNVSSFMYSFAGAFLSSIIMALAIKFGNKYVSIIGVSLLGSSFHNIAQIIVSIIILGNIMMISYLPILLLIGIFTGIFVGMSSNFIVKTISKNIKIEHREWIK